MRQAGVDAGDDARTAKQPRQLFMPRRIGVDTCEIEPRLRTWAAVADAVRIVGVEPRVGERLQGLRSLEEGYIPPLLDLSCLDGRFLGGRGSEPQPRSIRVLLGAT